MDKIKRFNATIIAVLVVIVLGFAFYWYEYRPTQIRKHCLREMRKIDETSAILDLAYKACLRCYGLRE